MVPVKALIALYHNLRIMLTGVLTQAVKFMCAHLNFRGTRRK